MSVLSDIVCGNCIFFNKVIDSGGYCKRYPPTLINIDGSIEGHQPFMEKDDVCGEFKENREAYLWPR